MKTAVLITGQMRTFARTLPNLKAYVLNELEDPAFFVSCADDEQAKSAELLRDEFPKAQIEIERVTPGILPEPPARMMEHAPYSVTPTRTPGVSPAQGILRQLWHMSRGYSFAIEKGAGAADVFVRLRPDLHFHEFRHPLFTMRACWQQDGKPAGVCCDVRPLHPKEAICCWWGNFGGVNDRFAFLGSDAASAWFQTYDDLPALFALGYALHPESLVGANLKRRGCVISRTLRAEFGFKRIDGSFQEMTPLVGEIALASSST